MVGTSVVVVFGASVVVLVGACVVVVVGTSVVVVVVVGISVVHSSGGIGKGLFNISGFGRTMCLVGSSCCIWSLCIIILWRGIRWPRGVVWYNMDQVWYVTHLTAIPTTQV